MNGYGEKKSTGPAHRLAVIYIFKLVRRGAVAKDKSCSYFTNLAASVGGRDLFLLVSCIILFWEVIGLNHPVRILISGFPKHSFLQFSQSTWHLPCLGLACFVSV